MAAVATGYSNETRPGLKFAPLPSSIGGMLCFRQGVRVAILGCLCCLATGCSISIPRDLGLAERCADVMRRAYPSADIEITKSEAAATSLTRIVARVEGTRTDLPPDAPLRRDLGVECGFDENVLTEFHWTAGPTR
jgi:hypothetical protein